VEKPVLEQGAQILRFPNNPELVKELKVEELLLLEDLNRSETYDERIEIRKDLRDIREKLYEAIKHAN
jgi:vancomycin permeability regulator SanA